MQTTAQEVPALGPRAEEVYRELLADIEAGRLAVDSRLPVERDLSARFAVSRTTVRAAMAQLLAEGRVSAGRGRAIHVRCPPVAAARGNSIAVMYHFNEAMLPFLQDLLLRRGLLLSVYAQDERRWDPAAEARFLDVVRREEYRGLLAFCSPIEPRNEARLRQLVDSGVRVVHVEHYREEPPEQGYVLPDYRRAAHMGTVRALLAGYEHVCLLGRVGTRAPYARLVRAGYETACEEHAAGTGMLLDMADGRGRDREWMANLLAPVPSGSAILAMGARPARQALTALRDLGRDVPNDYGVIGIQLVSDTEPGDVDLLSFDRPALLTRAVDAICRPAADSPVRELVKPEHLAHGTLRP